MLISKGLHTRLRRGWFFVLVVVLYAFLFSCQSDILFTADKPFTDALWHKDTVLRFDYFNQDTIQPCDLYFYIRHNPTYPHANLYLFLEIDSPEGTRVTDTVSFMLASPQGEWYGKGFATSKQLLLPYHSDFRFLRLGKYVFSIRHGMRYDKLPGVEDFGLQIYEHQPKQDAQK